MIRISRGLKAVAALGVSGLAVTLLGACTPAKLGAAAMVGDQRISTTELTTAVKQWQQAYTANPLPADQLQLLDTGSIPRSVLYNLVVYKLTDVAAQRQGVRISDGAIDNAMASVPADRLRSQAVILGIPPQRTRDFVRFELEKQGIAKQLQPMVSGGGNAVNMALANVVKSTAKSIRIDVNPRYGQFDYRQLAISANAGRLSRPETPQLPAQG